MWIDFIAVFLLLLNLMTLSSNRIGVCIRMVAVQGVVIGCIPIIYGPSSVDVGVIISSALTIILKGMVFPVLLFRALQAANIRKEVEPVGGYPLSILSGVVIFALSFWLSSRFVSADTQMSLLVASVSFATFFTGVLLIVTRKKAITQVIGYLMLENGICFFGAVFLGDQSLLVELALLLDVFVAVFVMGIAICHINREFDHINTDQLIELKDVVTKSRVI